MSAPDRSMRVEPPRQAPADHPPFDHRDPGTSEEQWRRAAPWQDAPALDLAAGIERLVVLAAHPDDETLGAGGLIHTAGARGVEVTVVVATDGEGSHPAPDTALQRRLEVVRAVDVVAPGARIRFLALPDGGLREHEDELRGAMRAELADGRTTLVAAPWVGDGHRDHRIAGAVALSLASTTVRVCGYPIWLWHWADPARVDASGWRVLPLDDVARAAKAAAIGEHRSQLQSVDGPPIVHDGMRAHFARDLEVFVVADEPVSDAGTTVQADYFDGFYARHDDPWGLESRWYERRKRALLAAALPRERFGSVLEIGCATGLVTAELVGRADHVLAVDIAEAAVARTVARLGDAPGLEVRRVDVTARYPDGEFDLVVLSEVGYFWSAEALSRVLDEVAASLTAGGVLVACHWRHAFEAAPQTGDDVHAMIAKRHLPHLAHYEEDDFLLDVWASSDAPHPNGPTP